MNAAKPPHRLAVRLLIGLGTVLTVLAIFAVWTERQGLDTDEWVETSSKLLEDEEIQTALSAYLTDELFANVDVQAELAARLPPRLKPLAGPIAGAVRQATNGAAQRAMESGRLQNAWAEANRAAHQRLIDLVEDKGEFANTDTGDVDLELKPLVQDLATQVGLSADVANRLPPDVASLRIISGDQIDTAQKIVKLIKGLAVVLSLLALGSFALAIYLSRGRRQTTVLWCGVGLIVAGVVVLAVRQLAGGALVDSLVTNESATEAGDHAWSIGTSLMRSIATTVIVYGILFVIASWLASATGSARWARRQIAPILRQYPGWCYSALVAAALIYFAFAPTHGLRAVLTLTLLTALAAFGLAALRRQTAEEFPPPRT